MGALEDLVHLVVVILIEPTNAKRTKGPELPLAAEARAAFASVRSSGRPESGRCRESAEAVLQLCVSGSPEDRSHPVKQAPELDALGFNMSRSIRHDLDFNFAIDDLNDKQYCSVRQCQL